MVDEHPLLPSFSHSQFTYTFIYLPPPILHYSHCLASNALITAFSLRLIQPMTGLIYTRVQYDVDAWNTGQKDIKTRSSLTIV